MTAMCTIVARNYLAHARVLARSFISHHPDVPVYVLILDDVDRSVDDSDEPFRVLHPADVLDGTDFLPMRVMYDVLELATAVKPWVLRTLLDRHGGPVAYLDPDIEVFSALSEAAASAARHPIVLTPHLTRPLPRDGRTPDEDFILKSGVFNLGFVVVSEAARPFLDWWAERLRTECIVAPERHRFVDQRWVDLAAGAFDHEILRHPGYNVAYWNIGTRSVGGRRQTGYSVDGEPLRFFHFSGFDASDERRLSRHEGELPRLELSTAPSVRELIGNYQTALLGAGLEEASRAPYGYAVLPDGTALTRELRRGYREGLLRHERAGEAAPPDPFDDPHSFHRWFSASDLPAPTGWRYTDRWSQHYPEELEHLLMAVSRRPVARRAVSRLARWLWQTTRRIDRFLAARRES